MMLVRTMAKTGAPFLLVRVNALQNAPLLAASYGHSVHMMVWPSVAPSSEIITAIFTRAAPQGPTTCSRIPAMGGLPRAASSSLVITPALRKEMII